MEILIRLWVIVYPILCVFVPCIVYQILASRTQCEPGTLSVRHRIWSYIFILYIFLVLEITGIGSIWDIGRYGTIIRIEEINWIPFESEGIMTYLLNVILFIPLGFLLPLIWQNYRHLLPTAVIGASFSFAIEIGQLFNRRQTDIDDLLMNTLGTIFGFGIWAIFYRVFHTEKKQSLGLGPKEAITYISLSVASLFFLYNWRFTVSL